MTMPAIQVIMGFTATAAYTGLFVLDKGTLGGSDTVSSSTVAVDVTQWCTQQIDIPRGRNRATAQFAASTLTLVLRNEDRRFDPTNTASPYFPGILPRTPVSVFIAGKQVWGGMVDDYSLDYIKPHGATVTVSCTDGFGLLATAKLSGYAAIAESPGARMRHVVQRPEVSYPPQFSFAPGLSMIQAGTLDQVSALDHLQAVNASEGGLLYVDRTGTLQSQDRALIPLQFAQFPNGQMTWTDTGISYNGPCIPYQEVSLMSAVQLLFNRVEGTRTGGAKQTADDLASQAKYQIRTLSLPTLENDTDANVLNLCAFYLAQFSAPEIRFDHMATELAGLSAEQHAAVAALDIASVLIAELTPPGGGPKIKQLSMVERMSWALDASAGTCKLMIGLQDVTSQQYFILDHATFGVLDNGHLFYGDTSSGLAVAAAALYDAPITPWQSAIRVQPLKGA